MKLLIMGAENNFCHEIKDSVNWRELGVKVVGIATTEQEALDKIENYLPDLVLTDAKVKGCTVFTIIRKVRKKGLNPLFAIITEHRNYEYVREAANLGVEKFLQFPLNSNKPLIRLVTDVENKITREEEKKRKLKEHDLWRKERVLATLCYGSKKISEEIKKYCEEIKQLLQGSQYVVFLVETNDPESVRNQLDAIFSNEKNYIGSFSGFNMVVGVQRFHSGASDNHVRDSLKNFFERFCDLCKRDRKVTAFANISAVLSSPSEIVKGFNECVSAKKLRFLYDDDKVTFYNDIANIIEENRVPDMYDKNNVEEMLRGEKKGSIHRIFRLLLNEIKKNPVYNTDATVGLYRNIAMDIIQMRIMLCGDVHDIQATFERITTAEKITELSKKIENYAIATIDVLHDIKLQKSLTPVNKAIYYIEQNYRSDINLQGVSDFVGLAPAYFSRLFKKEVGSSFIEYVMQMRCEKAKNLIANTEMKIYEVCSEVGYTDTRYFIKMFKSVTGMTPMQFKRAQYRKSVVEE